MLRVECLESRSLPAPLIPGYDGPEEWIQGNFLSGRIDAQTAVVAGSGGSCRLMLLDGPPVATSPVLLNVILFDPSFRGGGHLAVIRGMSNTVGIVGDTLLAVPGYGGGPVVDAFKFNSASGRFELSNSFFAPYDASFRGGLRVSSGDLDRDGYPEALFLPGDGGGPRLTAVDMTTFETELSVWVGNPDDLSGDAQFEPTGGTANIDNRDYILIQHGPTVDNYAPTSLVPY